MRATGTAPLRLLVGSFLVLITCGTALLLLPAATPPEAPIGGIDALFTATSATCVTGLVVRDTGTAFTPFGQLVILGLIQAGGLGVMTFSLLVFALFRSAVPLVHRSIYEQTLGGSTGEKLRRLVRLVFVFTFTTEAAGAAVLFLRFVRTMDPGRAAYAAVFHAVSAFCNAGFGLWADSLTAYRGDPWVNATVMVLIVLGGLGFVVVHDLLENRGRPRRLSVHTKLALSVSAVLIGGGALAFWALEAPRLLFGLSRGEQAMASLFQSVTARTAGFNTVDIAALAPATLFLLVLLMLVGGSPGSCAGGIKTTTFGVLVLAAHSRLRGRLNVNAFGRTLTPTTVRNTLSIAMGGGLVVATGLFALLLAEAPEQTLADERAAFLSYLFETASALGTVGLSTGVTPTLGPVGRLLIVVLMFVGRLGPLTVASALVRERPVNDWRHPEEDVMVG
jgi:trk system potassium uptake protein TrkH